MPVFGLRSWGEEEDGERLLKRSPPQWGALQTATGGQGVPSSIQRFIWCLELPGEGLAEPRQAPVRTMLQKGMRKQERQKCTTECEKNAHEPLEVLLGWDLNGHGVLPQISPAEEKVHDHICQQQDWLAITAGLPASQHGAGHCAHSISGGGSPRSRPGQPCFENRLWNPLAINPALPHTSWVTLGSFQNCFTWEKKKDNHGAYLTGLWWRLNMLINIRWLTSLLTHRKCPINVSH